MGVKLASEEQVRYLKRLILGDDLADIDIVKNREKYQNFFRVICLAGCRMAFPVDLHAYLVGDKPLYIDVYDEIVEAYLEEVVDRV